jgi:hypothetical protein
LLIKVPYQVASDKPCRPGHYDIFFVVHVCPV